MDLRNPAIAQAQMLIRRPVSEVFKAFVDPAVTTRFWFTKSSGKLEAGRDLRWDWEMYGASASVCVKAVDPNKRISIEWGDPPRAQGFLLHGHAPLVAERRSAASASGLLSRGV